MAFEPEAGLHQSEEPVGVTDQVVGLTLGYNNSNMQLCLDGQRRNFFYSPDAQFYLDITANLDVIYSKVTGRGEKAEKADTASASSRQEL